jgi:hypothetical protein
MAIMLSTLNACSKGGLDPVDPGNGPGTGNPNHTYNNEDTIAPVLEIHSPVEMQVFTSGSSIEVKGKISDDLGLYQGRITIVNNANNSVLKEQLYEIHGTILYNFNISYLSSVSSPSQYTVTVFFEDHGLNTVTKSVKIKVNP